MAGAYLQSSEVEPLLINQPVGFLVNDDEHALQLKDELADWLVTDEPVELQFDDEPGRTYYAVVQNTLEDFEKMAALRQGTIQFLCLDPYGYGPEKHAEFPSDNVTLTNNGTAEAKPIFEMEVLEPITFAMIQKGEEENAEYQMIGTPADDDVEVVDSRQLIYSENGQMEGWMSNPTRVDRISGAISNGTMTHDGTGIIVSDYGSPVSGYDGYGPAIIKELPEVLQDFEIQTVIDTRTENVSDNFRIEVYGFDENLNMLGKIGISDVNRSFHERNGLGRIGEYVNSYTRYLIDSGNFRFRHSGKALTFYIKWKREGNQFRMDIYRIVNGEYRNWVLRRYTDTSGEWLGKLKYIQVYIRTYRGRANPAIARVNKLDIYKLIKVTEDQTPYIAYPGDIITFDHVNGELLINGEDISELKQFGGSFFKLSKGENNLIVAPSESLATRVRYRERFR